MAGEKRVLVVGAGVSGLSAAWRLQRLGFDVTVLESEDQVGGKTAASRRDGFILNRGATVLGAAYEATLAIAREVGVESEIVAPPAPLVGVVRDGEVHLLRAAGAGALLDFLRTDLLSPRSKLLLARAGLDSFRARHKAGFDQPALRAELDTESVAEYCDRRLNAEIRDRLLGPLLGGLYLVDGLRASVADLFFSLNKVLAGGMLGYRGGIDFFARAIAERLDVVTQAEVTRVERSDGATVAWTRGGVSHDEEVAGVVLTVAAPLAPKLYPELDPEIQALLLEGLEQSNFLGLRFALSARPAGDALLVVVPTGELGGLATVTYEHNVSPGCAPAGKGLVGAFVYDDWWTPRMQLSDDELLEAILPELDHVVPGIAEMIEFAEITRWAPGAPRSVAGSHRVIAEIDRRIDPTERVQLAGDYLSIPSINGSVVSGEAAALRLATAIGAA